MGMTPLAEYLQKAAGQLACARDSAKEISLFEMSAKLAAMVRECEKFKEEELADYERRNGRKP